MYIIKILIIIMLATNTHAHCKNHKDFIYELKNKIDNTIFTVNKANQIKMLQEIIQDNVDIQKISRFVMGKHWRLTQEATRADFLREYEAHFVQLCIKILYNNIIKNCRMTIMGATKVDNQVYVVNTRFSHDDGEEFTNIDFRVTEKNGLFVISDIILSGMSISINQRTMFSKKIDTYGIEQIIKELKHENNS
jgi:phospholipid transport system substrate-binding protein